MDLSDRADGWDATTMTADAGEVRRLTGDERVYLIVFEADSSRMVPLPAAGEAMIGRAEGLEVRVLDASVSRRHACLGLVDGQAELTDLGSQNGTRVNGERINGTRPLVSGDVLTVGSIVMSFHTSLRHVAQREQLSLPAFQQRAEQEVERALRFERPLAMIAIDMGTGEFADRPMVTRALEPRLRLIDMCAWAGAEQLLVLRPETDATQARRAGDELVAALLRVAPGSRIGIATCPADGCDVDTLIGSARAAAAVAAPSQVAPAALARSTRIIGDRAVVVAEPAMSRLYALIERLAPAELAVLVCGETGSGKELAATALHEWSPRRGRSLVSLNCAAIAETLVESELFGHDKGAFSGAVSARAGLLESASGGTVFLDEIGELSLAIQAKLLRVLETRRVTRIGESREREIDLRIVAATNRNLDAEVHQGRFRRDLYFRLSGATLWLPPLRDRKRELPLLAQIFLDEACLRLGRDAMHLSMGAIQALAGYGWPGNVRELKNVMDYLAATVAEGDLDAEHVLDRLGAETGASGVRPLASAPDPVVDVAPATMAPAPRAPSEETRQIGIFRPLDEEIRELERRRIDEALVAADGNQTRAAELISMPLRTFINKVKLYELSPRQRRR